MTIGTKVLSEAANYATSIGGMTSARGRCHTFDERADGYLRGEGCGVAVLAPAEGTDTMPGSAVKHNGQSATFTALNGSSQQLLLRASLEDAGAPDVAMVEAHGTGTPLGDPIEAGAVSALLGIVMIGGLKASVGHTESTAGIAGVLKTAVTVDVGSNAQLRRLNPYIREGVGELILAVEAAIVLGGVRLDHEGERAQRALGLPLLVPQLRHDRRLLVGAHDPQTRRALRRVRRRRRALLALLRPLGLPPLQVERHLAGGPRSAPAPSRSTSTCPRPRGR